MPADIGKRWTRKDLERTPMTKLIERNRLAVSLVRESVNATLADVQLAERLKVEVGSPLLKVTRVSYDRNERAVDFMIGLYPPNRYQYVVTLPRHDVSGLRRKSLS